MIRPKFISYPVVSLVAGLLVLAAPATPWAAEINLTYAFFAPARTFPGKQMAHWAEQVGKRTGGKVAVKTFPAGTLLGATEMYDGVTKGVAASGRAPPPPPPARSPLPPGFSPPMVFPNPPVSKPPDVSGKRP